MMFFLDDVWIGIKDITFEIIQEFQSEKRYQKERNCELHINQIKNIKK